MTPEAEAKIISLCERVGMPWDKQPRRVSLDHPWDGLALNIAHGARGLHAESDIVHDVAHWLVAAPERRAEPDFGLDRMACFRPLDDVDYPSPGESIDEEQHASLLGILLERHLGLDWRYTWEFHSWHVEGWRGLRPIIRALRQRGLIRGLTPTCLLASASGDATLGRHAR